MFLNSFGQKILCDTEVAVREDSFYDDTKVQNWRFVPNICWWSLSSDNINWW